MKRTNSEQADELWPEYDVAQLPGRVRGKYVNRYHMGTNLVRLEDGLQIIRHYRK